MFQKKFKKIHIFHVYPNKMLYKSMFVVQNYLKKVVCPSLRKKSLKKSTFVLQKNSLKKIYVFPREKYFEKKKKTSNDLGENP